jgi:hypothetical protein
MKIAEITNVPIKDQTKKPQSAGSRGLNLFKKRPTKRFFDTPISRKKQ